MHQFFVLIDKKYLGMYLDETLNFNLHIKKEMIKALKGIGITKKLSSKNLPLHYLVTIYKSFVRPHLDCGDIIYDQPNNESFTQKIERIRYNAVLAITGAIKGTSQNKLYSELGFESLKFRRWFRRQCTFLKIKTTGKPEYLFDIIPKTNHLYNTCFSDVTTFYSRTDVFKYSFFPSTILEWNKLDRRIRQSTTMLSFRNALLKIGRPTPKPVYNILDPNGLKLLTRLRLGLSHLNKYQFNHNFKECVNPLCSCNLQVESVSHFLLHCNSFTDIRKTLFNELQSFDENILNQSDNEMVEILLYRSNNIKF